MVWSLHRLANIVAYALILCLAACTGAAQQALPSPTPALTNLTLPPGYTAVSIPVTLNRPTQMINAPNGRIWIAQLNGGERDGTGQLLSVALEDGTAELLLSDLFKPTGIALLDGALWIAAGRDILRAPLDENGRPTKPEIVLSQLPFNGRSNGTLTVSPDHTLIYETSGGNDPDSGKLWELDPANPTQPRQLASGLKGAYAHVFDENGRLWITEIGDGAVNGQQPPEEINLVVPGADFGWPGCYGYQEAALNRGGTAALCAQTRAPVVLFSPQSTPTSIAISPWQPDTLLVALWIDKMVMRVSYELEGDNARGTAVPFITGFAAPQHLLVLPDQSLLVSDHADGTLYRITQP